MKNYLIILLQICLFTVSVNKLVGQTEKEKDSLVFVLKYAESDEKLKVAKDFGHLFYKSSPKKVVEILDEVLEGPSTTKLDSVDIYFLKSLSFYYLSDFRNHSQYHRLAKKLIESYNGPQNKYYFYVKSNIESTNAIHAVHSGSHSDALNAYLSASEYAEKSLDLKRIYKANLDLGSYFLKDKQYEAGVNILRKCLIIINENKSLKDPIKFKTYSEIAYGYMHTNKLDSADYYLNLIPKEEFNFASYLIQLNIWQESGEYFKALNLISSLLNKYSKEKGNPKHWMPTLMKLKGNNQYELKQFKDAEAAWLESRLAYLEIGDSYNLEDISRKLYVYYKERGDFEKALIFHEENKVISDSMLFKNHDLVLKGVKASHELGEKTQENQKLKEQEIITNLTIERQKTLGVLSLLFMGLIGTFAYTFFKSAKTRRRLNDELKGVNNNLALKNQEIKNRADELGFISENLPEGIGRLNNDFVLTYYNKQLTNCLFKADTDSSENIFKLLGFNSEEQKSFEQGLLDNKELTLTWLCHDQDEIYHIHIVAIGEIEKLHEYLIVLQDVTELKNKEVKRISEVKAELNTSLVNKNKELVSSMMQISKRNSEIEGVLENLKVLYRESKSTSKLKLSKIINQLNATLEIEDSWLTFNTYFKEIHPAFLSKLTDRCNTLSNNEVRHCTFIKLGLSNREVAEMLNVSTKTVEVARYRIKKKLNLSKEESLNHFISDIKSNEPNVLT